MPFLDEVSFKVALYSTWNWKFKTSRRPDNTKYDFIKKTLKLLILIAVKVELKWGLIMVLKDHEAFYANCGVL